MTTANGASSSELEPKSNTSPEISPTQRGNLVDAVVQFHAAAGVLADALNEVGMIEYGRAVQELAGAEGTITNSLVNKVLTQPEPQA